MDNLEKVNPNEFGLEPTKVNELMANLPQLRLERNVLIEQYDSIINLDINDPLTSKKAKELKKLIKDNRTKGIEVWHKNAKEYFLRGGQFVDATKRVEVEINLRMEANLEDIEKHFEIQEKKRVDELRTKRLEELEPYKKFVFGGYDLGMMPDADYMNVFNGAKLQHEAEIEAKKQAEIKAEEERIAKAKAEEEERERVRIENERLKAELKEKEEKVRLEKEENDRILKAKNKAIEDERKAMEDKLEKERQKAKELALIEANKRKEAEAKLRAKVEAEKLAEAERLAEIQKAKKEADKLAKAPIKKKLNVWVDSFEINRTFIEADNETFQDILFKFDAFKKWAKAKVENL
jgi:hypothetical protein